MALVGQPGCGKSTIFSAVASTTIDHGQLGLASRPYALCRVAIGQDEAELVDLPPVYSLRQLDNGELASLKYLLWGDDRPIVSSHEEAVPSPLSRPDVIVQIVDASSLNRHLELSLELLELGLPMVIGLNMMDEARRKGITIDVAALSNRLGIPVLPMTAIKGIGIEALFLNAAQAVRSGRTAAPLPMASHLAPWCDALNCLLSDEAKGAFQAPPPFLASHFLECDRYFSSELEHHFPELSHRLNDLRANADRVLPRPLAEECEAARHHLATTIFEQVATISHRSQTMTWEDRFDALLLHRHWGLIGSLALFALVLFLVFEVSTSLDQLTTQRLASWASGWQPQDLPGLIVKAVVDGLIGLLGIVLPYMFPLVLMLVLLEESGVMQRVAFVVDRFFHHIGLHGRVALPFLLGLGCNVPAIAAVARLTQGRDRIIAALLITFVPCSARSAILLALGGKYLGGLGVLALLLFDLWLIALLGRLLIRRYPEATPGVIQQIPPYAIPVVGAVLRATWERTRDVLTIVTPLLVAGSIVLALLHHYQADALINSALAPITVWLLGLPIVLGVPILFGILRKELSLLMLFQALGSFDVGLHLSTVQIATFLLFLLLYTPCISTFAIMLRVVGQREALFSLLLSFGVALLAATLLRFLLGIAAILS